MTELRDRRTEKQLKLVKILTIVMLLGMLSAVIMQNVAAAPVGPTIVSNSTSNATPRPATAVTTAGGTFTTLILNTTGQTYRWKAYVGNVSGRLVLADATNTSIFDWRVTSTTGEIYATRSSSTVSWGTVSCANTSVINNEDAVMNMSLSSPDTINKTFNTTVHRSFYTGSVFIANSTCRSIATYVNGTAQASTENAVFQEVLLRDDSSNLIYTSLVNASTIGYNANRYDFQMILAENEYSSSATTYYLYVELT